MTGAGAANYTLSTTTATTTAAITALTVTPAVAAADKAYDGTTDATLTSCTVTGAVAGDAIACSGTATFDTAGRGGKTVTVSGLPDGRRGRNYTLSTTTATTTAAITAQTVTLTPDKTAPQVTGTAITFTAHVTGGTAPYQYKWWLFDGTTWTIAQDWSTAGLFTWTPAQARATYRVGVWVRNAGVTADDSSVNLSVPFVITAPPPATITGLTSTLPSPQVTGTAITFTAPSRVARRPIVQVVALRRHDVDDRAGLVDGGAVHLDARAGAGDLPGRRVGPERGRHGR